MKFREKRKLTDFEVVLLAGSERVILDVLDVSVQGLRIKREGMTLEPEDDVSVEIRERVYPSRITWVRNNEAGLEFDRPLPPEIFELISGAKSQRKKRRFLFG